MNPRLIQAIKRLRRETLNAILIGIPGMAYVLAVNTTASRGLIALHGFLLLFLCPSLVTCLDAAVPRSNSQKSEIRALVREVGIQIGGLSLATIGMLLTISGLTPITLRNLVGAPLLTGLLPIFLAYALLSMTSTWHETRQQVLRSESSEARARQEALAARIRPHFLFNALNCIEELTDSDPAAARIAVGQLSRLLRSVLTASAAPLSKLADELRLVDDYLALEQLRFGSRFSYDLPLESAFSELRLPSTILLTLAENAVKHGVECTPGPVRVKVELVPTDDQHLRIAVLSPHASGPSPRLEAGTGYGLTDVRERLALAFKNNSSLQMKHDGENTIVEFTVPR